MLRYKIYTCVNSDECNRTRIPIHLSHYHENLVNLKIRRIKEQKKNRKNWFTLAVPNPASNFVSLLIKYVKYIF